MNFYFAAAAVIAVILGNRTLLHGREVFGIPLVRSENLTKELSGSVGLKKVALRVCWHFATIAMWGAASILVFISAHPLNRTAIVVARIISATFFADTLLVFLTPGLRLVYLLATLPG